MFRVSGAQKRLEDFWGFFRHARGCLTVLTRGSQGRCRTQIFKLGENEGYLIVITNLLIALYSFSSLVHKRGPASLTWDSLEQKGTPFCHSQAGRAEMRFFFSLFFLFLRGVMLWRGKKAFWGMERVAERRPQEREPPILLLSSSRTESDIPLRACLRNGPRGCQWPTHQPGTTATAPARTQAGVQGPWLSLGFNTRTGNVPWAVLAQGHTPCSLSSE